MDADFSMNINYTIVQVVVKALHLSNTLVAQIVNYFDYRITNGFVEGKNNRIKTIKRMAYGYRNMNNLRLRILATKSKGARAGFHTY